jgi:hypothetical protein
MVNFVYDDVDLPASKLDIKAPTNPLRQISAADVNAVFTAIEDIRTSILDRQVNARQYGAVGDGVADDAPAINEAIAAVAATINDTGAAREVAGGFIYLPKGTYRLGSKLVGSNKVGLRGDGPASSRLIAASTFSDTALIENELQDGTQEFFFLDGLLIEGNKGNGAMCSVAVVNLVSLFINSFVTNCVILNGSNYGLRIAAAGSPGGSGPVYVANTWVDGCNGHNVMIEEDATNTGAFAGIVCVNLTSEHQASNKSAIYLKASSTCQWNFYNTHIEMGNPATGRTGITIDGASHVLFEGIQLQADPATITQGILITNAVTNVGIQIRGVTNRNLINPVLLDQKNSWTIGAAHIHNYVTADVTYQGAPRYLPVTGKPSIVAQSSAGTDRAWFDDLGQLTGNSANGAGLDVVGSEAVTNDRALTIVNNAKTRVFGWNFPVGGGGVSRFRYITGGVDIMQFGTDGTVFHYESPTFQKTALFQQALRFSAEIAPTQITSNQDNYNPTGFSTAYAIILTSDASRDITGFAGPTNGRRIFVFNNGAQNIVLKHDVTSTAANRIIGRGAADTTLTPKTGVALYYSTSITRWIIEGDSL